MSAFPWPAVALAGVLGVMLGEWLLSRRNERRFRGRGAVEVPDPVYRTMRWAYPLCFVVMAIEGLIRGVSPGAAAIWGLAVFTLAKGLKTWAIASLGYRWTYRVLVAPGVPLVHDGPYAVMRHPNYIAVVGELIGMALLVDARWSGPPATVCFALLLRARIRAEERALGIAVKNPAARWPALKGREPS
jgi:methyltransferase